MYDANLIKQICGDNAATYARNKNRGGRNNAQGSTFENYYAAARAAHELASALERDDDGTATHLESQQLCFVDDLIIDKPDERRLSQLKSGATSWTAGDHPIADDFRLQKQLDLALAIAASYELVVADADQRDALAASRPDDIDVDVVRFAYAPEVDDFLAENPELAAAIDRISIHDPKPSVRKAVFRTLVGAWVTSPERTTLAAFAEWAATGPGPLIPTLGPEYALPTEVQDHLAGLGMDIEIRKKHLCYRFAGMLGYSAFRAGTPEFSEFERFVVQQKPTDAYVVIAALRGA
jgi:hypothetical protein